MTPFPSNNIIRYHLGFGHWVWLVRQISESLDQKDARRLAFIIEHLKAIADYIYHEPEGTIEDLITILTIEHNEMLGRKDCRPPLDTAPLPC
jgi:hypothetical protein